MVSFGVLVVLELQMSSLPSVHLLLSGRDPWRSYSAWSLSFSFLYRLKRLRGCTVPFFGATLFNARSSMRSSILRRLARRSASPGLQPSMTAHEASCSRIASCLGFHIHRHTFPAGGTRVHKCSLLHSPDGVQY